MPKSKLSQQEQEGIAIALAAGAGALPLLCMKRYAKKELGGEEGYIGKAKDTDGKIYKWMVKHQSAKDNVVEKLASDILRHLLGDSAAVVKLLVKSPEEKLSKDPEISIASREVDTFMCLDRHYYKNCKRKIIVTQGKVCDWSIENVDGMKKVIAACVLVGNYDINDDNLGVITKKKDGRKFKTAAVVDYARAFSFRKQSRCKTYYTDVEDNIVINNYHDRGGDVVCDRSLLINQGFVDALDELIAKYDKDPKKLKDIATESVQSICDSYKAAHGEDFDLSTVQLPDIGDGVSLKNLGGKIVGIIEQRIQVLKNLSLATKIQLAVKAEKPQEEILQIVTDAERKISDKLEFLPEGSKEKDIKPKISIDNYLRSKGIIIAPDAIASPSPAVDISTALPAASAAKPQGFVYSSV